ncbi:MAG: ribosomal protein S18-alanine N-acetyltransferase [bacterium]|nr:ribosomal protein S18-alanine N-acetyltransferase [bacterium]
MKKKDLQEILTIEKSSFVTHWSKNMFLSELKNKLSYFLVAKSMNKVIGYGGFWLILDEAHLVNFAIHPHYRRKQFGKQLLYALLKLAISKGASKATLEVRSSNKIAQRFYEKFGFLPIAIRKNYYNAGENAIIMWNNNLVNMFGEKNSD